MARVKRKSSKSRQLFFSRFHFFSHFLSHTIDVRRSVKYADYVFFFFLFYKSFFHRFARFLKTSMYTRRYENDDSLRRQKIPHLGGGVFATFFSHLTSQFSIFERRFAESARKGKMVRCLTSCLLWDAVALSSPSCYIIIIIVVIIVIIFITPIRCISLFMTRRLHYH